MGVSELHVEAVGGHLQWLIRPSEAKNNRFTLTPGMWGRVRWNQPRTCFDTGEWFYDKIVFNIAIAESPQRYCFLNHSPDFFIDHMALLR